MVCIKSAMVLSQILLILRREGSSSVTNQRTVLLVFGETPAINEVVSRSDF